MASVQKDSALMTATANHILITGATGNVGRELASLLHSQGHPILSLIHI